MNAPSKDWSPPHPTARQRIHVTTRQSLLQAVLLCMVLATACIQVTPRVVKIGLVAPFEGRYREIGYDVIVAARLACREWAQQYSDTQLVFELVAYDDQGDPTLAIEQARKLIADPLVAIVIGHWRDDTTQAALPIYQEAGIPLITFSAASIGTAPQVYNLSPSVAALEDAARRWADSQSVPTTVMVGTGNSVEIDVEQLLSVGLPSVGGAQWGLGQFYALAGDAADGTSYVSGAALPADSIEAYLTPQRIQAFTSDYQEGSLGAPPGPFALSSYQATWLAMQQTAERLGYQVNDTPASRLRFDHSGHRVDAPVYLYRWQDGQRVLIEILKR